MSGGVASSMISSHWLGMVALAALAACGSERKAEAPGATTEATSAATARRPAPASSAPTAAVRSPVMDEPPAAAVAGPIPSSARQMILGVVDDWSAVPVELSRWERTGDGTAWRPIGEPWTGVVGSGTAWGRGLHGEGPPAGQSGPQKAEGDGKSPAGVFALGGAYGYAEKPPERARWPYTAVDASWHCVDDSASKRYGTIVDADDVTKDWTSSEKMKRRDALYTWVVDVAHNPSRAPKGGSCIFLHVWRAAGEPTVGCTAMPQPELETLLAWMDPAARPVFVLLPRPAYAALAGGWGLPSR
jgi:hypothetical protein